jgi:cobalt-zinc-cadmium efflux system outer membrane protein
MSILGAHAAWADDLTEADVVRMARIEDLDAVAAREAVGVAEAERLQTTLVPNPSVDWSHEYVPGDTAPVTSEHSISFTLPIDPSTRRTVRDHLGHANVARARSQALRGQSDVIAETLVLFYQLMAEQQRRLILQHFVDRLTEAARVVARRLEAGTVSGYDHTRIEIEGELAATTLRQSEARIGSVRAELSLRLGVGASEHTFSGSLEPDARFTGEPPTTTRPPQRRSLDLLRTAEHLAREARGAAAWAWIPELSLSAGPRVGTTGDIRLGYVLGLSADLPLFSRGDGMRVRAEAEHRLALARSAAAERATRIERLRTRHSWTTARREAGRFNDATRGRIERLERAVESGYREGERSIIELLDAHRARADIDLQSLALALAAKQAELALRASQGEFE